MSEALPLSEWQAAFERTRRADGLKFVLDPRLDGVLASAMTHEEDLAA